MKAVETPDALPAALATARSEAIAAFGRGELYLEKFLSHPRHIEVQVLADLHGAVVHLGERDCSLQRRHQKVLEEAPSPVLSPVQRADIGRIATAAVAKLGYRSAGTFEFLYEDGVFSFIEMNTRLQVEHPVTEMVCGIDLVREMIRIAAGYPLGFGQDDIRFEGHAIECRINAENPETFAASPGRIAEYHAPGGLGIRVDSALYAGYRVPPFYDSMVAKLIAYGPNRDVCLRRLRRALGEYVIEGIETTIPLHQKLLDAPEFITGQYDIHWLEKLVRGRD